jgi:HK97 family phage prohead protease
MDRIVLKSVLTIDEKANTVEGLAWPYATADKAGDIIKKGAVHPAAAELPMLKEHRTDQLIGLWTHIEERNDGLYVKGQFNETVLARGVRSQILTGRVDGLSIAFREKSSTRKGKNRIISALDLVEVSIVERPSHPGARLTHVKTLTAAHEIAEALNRATAALQLR